MSTPSIDYAYSIHYPQNDLYIIEESANDCTRPQQNRREQERRYNKKRKSDIEYKKDGKT